MTVVADIAQAVGVSQNAVRDELNRAALADGILAVILARSWTTTPEKIAESAGVTKAEMSSAILRYHDRATREQRATVEAYRTPARQRHVPVGDPPSPEHHWCKRGSHWVHRDDMGRARRRPDGIGDWCKPCWREYWRTKVATTKRSTVKADPPVVPAEIVAVVVARRRRSTGPTCVECKTSMRSVQGQPRCLTEGCSIGERNRRRLRRSSRVAVGGA